MPLLETKRLDSLPPHILQFHLRLDQFDYTICHVPGKQLYTADTLSRAPIPMTTSEYDVTLQELAELCVMRLISQLPASEQRLDVYRKAQTDDPVCATLLQYCQNGWPDKGSVDSVVKPHWEFQSELTVSKGLLLRGNRVVVPKAF